MSSSSTESKIPLLLKKMKTGSDVAWTEFHSRFFNFTYNASLNLNSGCQHTASEVTQETFCKSVRNLNIKLKTDDEVRKWLHCIVRTTTIDRYRKNKRRNLLLEKLSLWHEIQSLHPDWLFLADSKLEKVENLLKSLKQDEEILIRQFYFKGLSYKELSKKFNTSVKAIESKLARIRMKLATISNY